MSDSQVLWFGDDILTLERMMEVRGVWTAPSEVPWQRIKSRPHKVQAVTKQRASLQ